MSVSDSYTVVAQTHETQDEASSRQGACAYTLTDVPSEQGHVDSLNVLLSKAFSAIEHEYVEDVRDSPRVST